MSETTHDTPARIPAGRPDAPAAGRPGHSPGGGRDSGEPVRHPAGPAVRADAVGGRS
ncbi:hypothetical protein ACF061_18695 [Streptomyces sp. NPDC015220]|uniref:hypothetical protein n=1 Tax=Streptomyces sp. NPDC015220 TaxID=3364947 RepID=UPI0036FB1DF4